MDAEKRPQPAKPFSFRDRLLIFLVSRLGSLLVRCLGCTLRVRYENKHVEDGLRKEGKAGIYAYWHRWILIPSYTHRHRGVATLVSQHRDGELITQTALRLGFKVARGSSTRGGAGGLKSLTQMAEQGRWLAINPDGPRGPAQKVQPGVVSLSSLTSLPIVACGFAVSKSWVFHSWDRFVLPKPWARVCICFSDPIQAPKDLSKEDLLQYQRRIEEEILAAEQNATRFLQG